MGRESPTLRGGIGSVKATFRPTVIRRVGGSLSDAWGIAIAIRSSQDFPFCGVSFGIKRLNLIDGLEVSMIGALPDDLLFMSHFKYLRLLADMAMS